MKGKAKKAGGGGLPMKVSGNPDVFKEAESRKKGGKVKAKASMKADEGKTRHRLDRPGRKSGGRVGADKAPLSSAHGTTSPSKQAN